MGGLPTPEAAAAVAEIASRRPRDMSDAELEALPTGPFIRHSREATAEDFKMGLRGRWIEWEEWRPVRATPIQPDDIFAWSDSEGRLWDFGQWADGTWFKQISVLG